MTHSTMSNYRPPSAEDLGLSMVQLISKIRFLEGDEPLPQDHPLYKPIGTWPYHLKATTMANIPAIRSLEVAHEECRKFFDKAQIWRTDVPFRGIRTSRTIKSCRLRDEAISRSVELGHYQETDWTELPIGCHGMNVFGTPESKARIRIVEESFLNDCFSTDPTIAARLGTMAIPQLSYRTRLEIRNRLATARYLWQFDFDAYYPSIPTDPSCHRRFVIRHKKRYYVLRCLGTGARWSVVVAQSITYMIVDVDLGEDDEIGIFTIIDNILIYGNDLERFIDLVKEIATRITMANLQSTPRSDAVSTMQRSEIGKSAIEPTVFCGEEYAIDPVNPARRLIRNSTKTAAKLLLAKDLFFSRFESLIPTKRQFTALLSLISYAMHTLHISPARFWSLFAAHRSVCKEASIVGWDTPTQYIAPTIRREVIELIDQCSSRDYKVIPRPRHMATYDDTAYDLIIHSDASAEGWGAYILWRDRIFTIQRRWGSTLRSDAGPMADDLRRIFNPRASPDSEPSAIKFILRALPRFEHEMLQEGIRIASVTDHHAIPSAQRKINGFGGIGHGRFLNDLFRETEALDRKFQIQIDHFFVEGVLNAADPLSRNLGEDCNEIVWREVTNTIRQQLPQLKSLYCPLIHEDEIRAPWMR